MAFSSKESNTERSSDLKEILTEHEGIYRRTWIQTGAITVIDYNLQARGIEANDEHSAIVESHSSNSFVEMEAFAYITNTTKKVARKFEEKSQV